jgi:hypothetical protein
MLNEKEAWLVIRKAYAEAATNMPELFKDRDPLIQSGLCWAVTILHQQGVIDNHVQCLMEDHMDANVPKEHDEYQTYWFPRTAEGATQRVAWIDSILAKYYPDEKPNQP